MKQYKLDKSPIVYYISGRERAEWVLFIHAAFVNHNMFRSQIKYFKNKYNILTFDIIGHGKSTETKKGDSINKMSMWINDILKNMFLKSNIRLIDFKLEFGRYNGDIVLANGGVITATAEFATIEITCGTAGKHFSITELNIVVE